MYYGLEPPYRRAYKVSYNRPFQTRATRAVNILFGAEYPMIRSFKPLESIENSHFLFFVLRWLESQGYDVTYQAGIDTDRSVSSPLIFFVLSHIRSSICMYLQARHFEFVATQTFPVRRSRRVLVRVTTN